MPAIGDHILGIFRLDHRWREGDTLQGSYWIASDPEGHFWGLVFPDQIRTKDPDYLDNLFWNTRDLLLFEQFNVPPFWGFYQDHQSHPFLLYSMPQENSFLPLQSPLPGLTPATSASLFQLARGLYDTLAFHRTLCDGNLDNSSFLHSSSKEAVMLPFFGAEKRIGSAKLISQDELGLLTSQELHYLHGLASSQQQAAALPSYKESNWTVPDFEGLQQRAYQPTLFSNLPVSEAASVPSQVGPLPTTPPQPQKRTAQNPPQHTPPFQTPQQDLERTATPSHPNFPLPKRPTQATRHESPLSAKPPFALNWKVTISAFLGLLLLAASLYFFLFKPREEARELATLNGEVQVLLFQDQVLAAEELCLKTLSSNLGSKKDRQPFRNHLNKILEIKSTWRGTILLEVIPAHADIVWEKENLTLPEPHFELPMGEHRLNISAPGCAEQTITVKLESNEQIINYRDQPIRLQRHTGTLEISSKPAGIDLELRQLESESSIPSEVQPKKLTTPVRLTLPTGRYSFRWARPDLVRPSEQEFTISHNQTEEITQSFDNGLVTITTEPVDATIFLGSKNLGAAPVSFMLPLEGAKISARTKGWGELAATIEPDASKETHHTFSWPHGTVFLDSDPEGAIFSINGHILGKGPRKEFFPPGEINVFAERPGLDSVERTIHLAEGGKSNVDLTFSYAKAFIESTPTDAEVVAPSGEVIGMTPIEIFQRPGNVIFQIRKAGFEPVFVRESVPDGRGIRINATLERR